MGIFTITGPSGVGKTEVYKGIIAQKDLDLKKIVTCTTRAMRSNEVNGRDYHFVSHDHFRRMISDGALAEYEEVYGNYYGSRKLDIQECMANGSNPLFLLDIKGGLTMQSYFGERIKSIFLLPDNMGELMLRLQGRNSEGVADIERRIAHAEAEMEKAYDFDYRVVNKQNDLSNTIEKVSRIIRAELFAALKKAS